METPNRRQARYIEALDCISEICERSGCTPVHAAFDPVGLGKSVENLYCCLSLVERPDSARISVAQLVVVLD